VNQTNCVVKQQHSLFILKYIHLGSILHSPSPARRLEGGTLTNTSLQAPGNQCQQNNFRPPFSCEEALIVEMKSSGKPWSEELKPSPLPGLIFPVRTSYGGLRTHCLGSSFYIVKHRVKKNMQRGSGGKGHNEGAPMAW